MRAKITGPRKTVVYEDSDDVPFWIEHIVWIILLGVVVVGGGVTLLIFIDGGLRILAWAGLAFGVILTVALLIPAWRRLRAGDPARDWGGDLLMAIGWGGLATVLAAGLPYLFFIGPRNLEEWQWFLPGGIAIVLTGVALSGVMLQASGPLPPLDRTPRTAVVTANTEDGEGDQEIVVRYRGADGREHRAELADGIHESWVDRFAPGTTWQVYAFAEADVADSVVFLAEAHEAVWRDGYKLNGVRMGGESGPLPAGPGSPFFREGAQWTFADQVRT